MKLSRHCYAIRLENRQNNDKFLKEQKSLNSVKTLKSQWFG